MRQARYPTRPSTDGGPPTEKRDIAQTITDKIVALLERGTRPWVQSWNNVAGLSGLPQRHNGERYRGVNLLLLWAAIEENGFRSNTFMTFKQALDLGGCVIKGSKGTPVCYYGTADAKNRGDDEEAGTYRFLKSYTVFCVDQIANLPERYYAKSEPTLPTRERLDEIDAMVLATGAQIHHGGNQAYYAPGPDHIRMPHFEQFPDPECYYGTLLHELVHWSGARHRLDRQLERYSESQENRAFEELCAELGSAFLGCQYGLAATHLEDHASYIGSWLQALRNDKKLIFSAAAKAQAAVDFLTGAQVPVVMAEAA